MKLEISATQLKNCEFVLIIAEFNKKVNKTAKNLSAS